MAVAVPVIPGSMDWLQSTVIFDGHEMVGGVVSTTLRVKLQEFELPPQPSLAMQVTVWLPIPRRLPFGGVQETVKFVQLSEATGSV